MLNSSSRLDWQSQVAPVLTDYMGRMLLAGYSEGQRKSILQQALNIYDCMKKEDENGTRPLFRSKYWQFEERQKKKKKKKTNWSTRGGHIAPIFVPPTPNSELAKMLRKVAESEAEAGVMFKIVETGGNSVKSLIEKSNPTATRGYDETNCMACQDGRGKGGNCRLSNIQYEVECQLCPQGNKSVYIGESSRNIYTRIKEHQASYINRNEKSFMMKHQQREHQGVAGVFKAKVTDSFRDCLSRQVSEGVTIRRCDVAVMNGKSEWHQPALWRVQSELING